MKATSSGISVFFIQKHCWPGRSNANIMPWLAPIELRNIRPISRCSLGAAPARRRCCGCRRSAGSLASDCGPVCAEAGTGEPAPARIAQQGAHVLVHRSSSDLEFRVALHHGSASGASILMYQHIKVPEGGQKIKVNADFSLVVPDRADHPVHRRRRHRPRHHAGDDQGRRRGGREGLRRQEEDPLDGGLRRREVDPDLRPRRLAARRNAGSRSRSTWSRSRGR